MVGEGRSSWISFSRMRHVRRAQPRTAMNLRFPTVLFLALAAATAQTPDHLVGVTRNLGDLRHVDASACGQLAMCTPAGFPSAAGMPANAGGTAWDPALRGAWISNGQFLACVDDACNYLCTPVALPGMGGGTFVCGLEVVESRNELWAIDSAGVLHVLTRSCPPVQTNACPVAFIDPTLQTSGLAVDELNGLVFYARLDPALGSNVIAWANLTAPCMVLAGVSMLPCAMPTGAWTGLACDSVARRLYATDGLRLVTVPYQMAGPTPMLLPPICCPPIAPGPDPLIGLAVRPGVATSNGVSCNNGTCPACPTTLRLHNDSVLGNDRFGFELGQAAVGSLAWTVLGVGPCSLPGATVGPLCGPIHANPVLGSLGPAVIAGGGVCNGTASFPLPLPPNPAFAGWVLSAQSVVFCANPAGLGTAVSNCLSFELQGI